MPKTSLTHSGISLNLPSAKTSGSCFIILALVLHYWMVPASQKTDFLWQSWQRHRGSLAPPGFKDGGTERGPDAATTAAFFNAEIMKLLDVSLPHANN